MNIIGGNLIDIENLCMTKREFEVRYKHKAIKENNLVSKYYNNILMNPVFPTNNNATYIKQSTLDEKLFPINSLSNNSNSDEEDHGFLKNKRK